MSPTRRETLVGMYLLGRAMYGMPKADASTGWTNIKNATHETFTPGSFFKGKKVRCIVTAHNSVGEASVATPGTNPVKT